VAVELVQTETTIGCAWVHRVATICYHWLGNCARNEEKRSRRRCDMAWGHGCAPSARVRVGV